MEQNNWTAVRQQVVYARFQGPTDVQALNQLYGILRSYLNYFQPQMRLLTKTRNGARVSRRHDAARTPHQRLVASAAIPAEVKRTLSVLYRDLNPVALKREITRLQEVLLELARQPKEPPAPTLPTHPWKLDHGGFSRASFVRQRTDGSRAS